MKHGSGIEASRIASSWSGSPPDGGDPVQVHTSALKRAMDLVLAVPTLVAIAPVLGAIAIGVKLTDPGPMIFKQPRVGVGGKTFRCLKFRTMRVDATERLEKLLASDPQAAEEWRLYQKLRNDPRVTSFGKFLRQTSLDELPQLWNIIMGQMSVIGPRPITSGEIFRYGTQFHFYKAAKPGVIGLWQVNGRNRLTYEQRVAYDIEYSATWTIWSDIKITLKAIPAVLFGGGTEPPSTKP
jgi:lipopolysaccharide/colanic/teichoic acid biosynthesis glycosyltransferase